MEKCFKMRYLNSKNQVIISLNEQIKAILPLSESYCALENYQNKLYNDFQSVLSEQDFVSQAYTSMIHDLQILGIELNGKKSQYIGQFINFQNTKSKLAIDRENLISSWETLCNQFNKQIQQSVLLQQQKGQILENFTTTEQNVFKNKKLIDESSVKNKHKQEQNLEIQNKISKLTQQNLTLTKNILTKQAQVKISESIQEKDISGLKVLEEKRSLLQMKVQEGRKQNKQLTEMILANKAEIGILNHQKQYSTKLMESQFHIKENLQLSQCKLNNWLQNSVKEMDRTQRQNSDLEKLIRAQELMKGKLGLQKEFLKAHLNEVILANSLLMQLMKRSCMEDKEVYHILNKKREIVGVLQRAGIDRMVLKERTNELRNLKRAEKSASTWVNQFVSEEN